MTVTQIDRRDFFKGMGTAAAKGALVSGTFGLTSSRCPRRSGPSNPPDADPNTGDREMTVRNTAGGARRFRDARDRGCAFLLDRLRPDGGFGDVEPGLADYYKVPAALAACGETGAANRLCSWIRESGMLPDGDFGPRPVSIRGYGYTYYNSWVIKGAHRLGHFDLSQRGMDFLMTFRDSETGGFLSSPAEHDPLLQQDLWVVAGCGWSALYTGRIEVARGAGRWMETLMEAQPDYPSRLYGVYSKEQGLHVDHDPKEAFRYVLNQDAERDEPFYNPGIAGGFLAQLHQATGEKKWLELAREYLRLAEDASDYLYSLVRAGKLGWAASVLYTLTSEEKYREMAVRVGDSLIASQSAEGWWGNVGETSANNDISAEMVYWLDQIYQSV